LKNETSEVVVLPCSQKTVDVTIEQVPAEMAVSVAHNNHVEVDTKLSYNEKVTLNETLQEERENRKLTDRKRLANSRESPENNEDYPERTSHTPDLDNAIVNNAITIRKVNSEKQLNVNNIEEDRQTEVVISTPRIIIRKATEDWECDEEVRLSENCDSIGNEESPKTPISSEVEFILEHDRSSNNSPSIQKINSEVIVVEAVSSDASPSVKDDSNEKHKISTKKKTSKIL